MAQRLSDFVPTRVPQPPPVEDPRLAQWARDVTDELNKLPPFSVFSFNTPESNVSASPGTLGINVASGHTVHWQKFTGSGDTGWVSLTTA